MSEAFTFPRALMAYIAPSDVPMIAMEHFENNSRKYIHHKSYHPGNFDDFMLVTHANGDQTYIATQTKTYEGTSKHTEELTYLITLRNEVKVGHGEIRRDVTDQPIHQGRPFVGFIRTEQDFARQGLGRRMLHLMSFYARSFHGQKLFSGELVSDKFRALLESLVPSGAVSPEKSTYAGQEFRTYTID